MSLALMYEGFVRGAFSAESEHMIDRWGDPAQLANTDCFSKNHFDEVKVAVGYSMAIYNHHIVENHSITDEDYTSLKQGISKVICATELSEITNAIEEYRQIKNKYFIHRWNSQK